MTRLHKDYTEIMPFSWRCSVCDHLMPLDGDIYDETQILNQFKDSINLDQLDRHPLIRTDNISHVVLRSLTEGETTGLIITANGRCTNSNCGCSFTFRVWLELELERKDEPYALFTVLNSIILDGDLISKDAIPGLYRGTDIAGGLSDLYLRWWYLKGEIFVICPFISMNQLKTFDELGLKILKTHNSIMVSNPIYNPFKMIITRYHIMHNFKWHTTFPKLVKMYLKRFSEDGIFLDREPGDGLHSIFRKNLYGVKNRPVKGCKGEENEALKYASYFHGKLYGACLKGSAEVVITSYNYTGVEGLQLESLAFVQTSEENLRRQIEIFTNDQHMTISPIDLC